MSEPPPGASARAEYERRRAARFARHRERFGRLASLTFRIDGKRRDEEAWREGAEGEEYVARRLEKHLRKTDARLLHDLRVPGSRANIDHLCIAPGGVTVIDSKNYRGRVEVRRKELWVNGRRRPKLITGVLGQIEVVREALAAEGLHEVDLRGALAMAKVDGLPLLRRLQVDGVVIDGPRPIARLAARRPKNVPLNVELAEAAIRARLARA